MRRIIGLERDRITRAMSSRVAHIVVPVTALSAGLLIGLGGPTGQVTVVVAVVLVSSAFFGAATLGMEHLLTGILLLNAVLVPMNGLQLGTLMTVSDSMLLAAVPLAIMMRLLGAPRPSAPHTFRPFMSSLALMGSGGLLATVLSSDPLHGLPGLVRFSLSTLAVLGLYVLWRPSQRWIRFAVWAFVGGACLSVVVGLVQDTTFYRGRATGLATHPNHLGMVSMLACGGIIALASTTKRLAQKAAYGLATLLVVGVVLSGSRAAVFGLAVSFTSFLIAARNWRILRIGFVIGAMMLLGTLFASSKLPTGNAVARLLRPDATAEVSDRERLTKLDRTLAQIQEHPVTGSGFEFALEAHSLYLQLWVSAGLIGLAGLLCLYGQTVRLLLRIRTDPFGSALLATFLGYLTAGAVSNILWDRYVWTFLAFGLAAVSLHSVRPDLPGPLSARAVRAA